VLLFSNEPWEDRVSFVPAHVKLAVGIAAIEALDIRVGTIQAVGEVAGSRKLVKLTVSFGDRLNRADADIERLDRGDADGGLDVCWNE